MEKFNASGITKAQPPSTLSHNPSLPNESWIAVVLKKSVKAMIHARPKSNSLFNPNLDDAAKKNTKPSQPIILSYHNPALLGPMELSWLIPWLCNKWRYNLAREIL